jgi:3-isopropylmalate/(R)-2-methylmalate dehydratase large subunit
MIAPRTLYQKLWDAHVVAQLDDETFLLYVDRHLLTEITSPQAFDGLRSAGRAVRRPLATVGVADHNVPTSDRHLGISDPESRAQVAALERNTSAFGIPYLALEGPHHGIVHVIGPEQGLTLPGMTIVCGDSHTSTHGAFGALAFGIGTSEVEHVLATQTIMQRPAKTLRVTVDGRLPVGVEAKDAILCIIRAIGAGGAGGHVIEYAGETIRDLDMAGRMTICNMSIEAGARAGMIAPDEVTFAYLRDRVHAPQGAAFAQAVDRWRTLASDRDATFDRELHLDASTFAPMVTWGTSPEDVVTIDGVVPDPAVLHDAAARAQLAAKLDYMGLAAGQPLRDLPIEVVFIGSCTSGRLEDLRSAARIARGRHVATGVRALVVPGSAAVKALAEREELDTIFRAAGFAWREAGCSMCVGMNPDRVEPGQRCASTSNRNFAGRQGPGSRTHLVSPSMAAAAAIAGRLTDVRAFAATG